MVTTAIDTQAVGHVKAQVRGLNFFYGEKRALTDINMSIQDKKVTALIGPSGCGKSTLLRCFNRMHDLYPGNRYEGEIVLHPDNLNILGADVDPIEVRMRLSMVFQKPNPFPKSIYDNLAFGPRLNGIKKKADLDVIVESSLKRAALWDEVKDRLKASAMGLSGGQQQRLCIARCIAVEPDVILMDEPCSALDPIATAHVETLIDELRENFTIVIVTHNMQQAARVSQRTAFFHLGTLVEEDDTAAIFTNPRDERTQGYITGRYG